MEGSRTFSQEDQIMFAGLSGDHNPLHMAPEIARRLLYGQSVVHGIHMVMSAVDEYFIRVGMNGPLSLRHCKIAFNKPLGVGGAATWQVTQEQESSVTIQITSGPRSLAEISLTWQPGLVDAPQPAPISIQNTSPRTWALTEFIHATGLIPLEWSESETTIRFPTLVRVLGARQVTVLLSLSRLVGMECPGMDSIFAGFQLDAVAGCVENHINYRVQKWDSRFRRLRLNVSGAGFEGSVTTYVRHPPHIQPDFATLRQMVRHDDFVGQRALVIGGSRGLGEVVAKLLAAGGAQVRLTWQRGRTEAEQVVAQIIGAGGKADCRQFDVLQPDNGLLENTGFQATHLYFMATPFIFNGDTGFQAWLFERFCKYYVTGFASLVETLLPGGLVRALYPSSAAIDEMPPGMTEYSAAKLAGELVCDGLEKEHSQLRISRPRLPRLDTDQTATFMPLENADASEIVVRELRALAKI